MTSQTTCRHPKYYFDDGSVVFLTKDKTLFRLHKSILKLHSTFFDDLFQLDQPELKDEKGKTLPTEGSSDDRPITADVRDAELESICVVLYEMPLTDGSELGVDQAVALLHVSTKYQFEKVHKKATNLLEPIHLPPWERYALAIDCLVDPWIVRSYTEICSAVQYHPAEIVAEFAQRHETDKLSRLLTFREEYRTKLLLYAHGAEYYPYPKLNPPTSFVCANCLPLLKRVLIQILSGNATAGLDTADVVATPLLRERLTKLIQLTSPTPVNICANCRPKEKLIVSQVLGIEDLEKEVKKVMHLVS
ncbi:hypothetical protein FRC10_009950 [Ceratobasidium sp. 414]|nr:hypothetical protein FRC10_009950 [Ceratobasidium sp. 414]